MVNHLLSHVHCLLGRFSGGILIVFVFLGKIFFNPLSAPHRFVNDSKLS